MAYFPEHLAVPVRFQDHAAFEWKATEKIVLRRASVVKQCPAFREIAGQAGRVRHVPGVDDVALKVDEIHGSVLHEMRGKKRKSRRGALRIAGAQTNTPAFEGILLDRRCSLATSNEGARTESGNAGEQRASLEGPGLMVDHRMVSISDACERNSVPSAVRLASKRFYERRTADAHFTFAEPAGCLGLPGSASSDWPRYAAITPRAQRINFRPGPRISYEPARQRFMSQTERLYVELTCADEVIEHRGCLLRCMSPDWQWPVRGSRREGRGQRVSWIIHKKPNICDGTAGGRARRQIVRDCQSRGMAGEDGILFWRSKI
jgi:hypothetical protein